MINNEAMCWRLERGTSPKGRVQGLSGVDITKQSNAAGAGIPHRHGNVGPLSLIW